MPFLKQVFSDHESSLPLELRVLGQGYVCLDAELARRLASRAVGAGFPRLSAARSSGVNCHSAGPGLELQKL